MGKYIAEKTVKKMIEADIQIKGSKVAILGLTFKENCGDLRNSKVADIINELHEYGIKTLVTDCEADPKQALVEYGLQLIDLDEISEVDCVLIAVAHDCYKKLTVEQVSSFFKSSSKIKVLIDLKGVFDRNTAEKKFMYWRL
jgi:UDP-N-acetyl-D-galactosamine dehydrogenase